MTGLPRRNQRSHDADAAEPGNEGQAAEPERAPTDDAPTQQLPATAEERGAAPVDPGLAELMRQDKAEHAAEAPSGEAAGAASDPAAAPRETEGAAGEPTTAEDATIADREPATAGEGATAADREPATTGEGATAADREPATTGEGATAVDGEPAPAEGRARRLPRIRRKRRAELLPPEPLPLPLDPAMPAGLEPAEIAARPPVGRRGRLRRRLRYLRRARELMLRDLGGLVYEVHRTGGGDVNAHRGLLGAKVQRLANVDRETHAIEDALTAPRGDAVIFQPGIGGTCPVCSELYGSSARFCANCGTPLGATPALGGPLAADPAPPAGPIGPAAASPVRTPAAPAIRDAPTAHAPLGLAPAPKPADGSPNGHPDTTPPELSSGDPLAARERP